MSFRYFPLFGLFLALVLSAANPSLALDPTPVPPSPPTPSLAPAPLSVSWQKVAEALEKKFEGLLHFEKGQWVLAGVALALGLVMVCDGETVFKYLVVVFMSFSCFFGLYVFFQVKCDQWANDQDPNAPDPRRQDLQWGAVIIFVQFSCVVGYVVQRSYHGVQMIFGVALGIFATLHVHAFCVVALSPDFANNGWLNVALVNIFSLFGIWLISAGKIRGVISPIALLSAFIGGCLISCSLAFFVELYVVKAHPTFLGKIDLPKEFPSWIDFLRVLIRPGMGDYKDVGVFAGHNDFNDQDGVFAKVNDVPCYLNAIVGVFVWMLFFLFGACFQKKAQYRTCCRRREKVKNESLKEPLAKRSSWLSRDKKAPDNRKVTTGP